MLAMRTIAIWVAKGGTGKTTAALGLASALGARGRRVLVVDMDGQATATRALGVEPSAGLLDGLRDGGDPDELVVNETNAKGVACIPGSAELASAERAMAGEAGAETLYRSLLGRLPAGRFDFILTDCPPGVGMLVVGALTAAGEHLAPVTPDPFAVSGLRDALSLVDRVRQRLNPALLQTRILLSRVPRTRAARLTAEGLRERFGALVLSTEIPDRAVVVDAAAARRPVIEHDPESPVATAFHALAEEIER